MESDRECSAEWRVESAVWSCECSGGWRESGSSGEWRMESEEWRSSGEWSVETGEWRVWRVKIFVMCSAYRVMRDACNLSEPGVRCLHSGSWVLSCFRSPFTWPGTPGEQLIARLDSRRMSRDSQVAATLLTGGLVFPTFPTKVIGTVPATSP